MATMQTDGQKAVGLIAERCEAVIAAHEARYEGFVGVTENEKVALASLRYTLVELAEFA